MSFHTEQAAELVSTMPVSFEQPLRADNSTIASANRILNSPEGISRRLGLNFSHGVGSYLNINRAQNHKDHGSNRHIATNRSEQEWDHAPSSSSLLLRQYHTPTAAKMITRRMRTVGLRPFRMLPPSFTTGMIS